MKKIILLQIFFAFCFQYAFCQDTTVISSVNQQKKVRFGVYAMPTFSLNIGKKIVPKFYDSADCSCAYFFENLKETVNIGFSFGLEVEIKKFTKRLSLSTGINLDLFYYSGTGNEIFHSFWTTPPSFSDPYKIDYSYKDYFLVFPFTLHHSLFNGEPSKMDVVFGVSGAIFLGESIIKAIDQRSLLEFEKSFQSAIFGNTGIDYFFGKRRLWNLGSRITSQLTSTPEGRRLASAGIKAGIFF